MAHGKQFTLYTTILSPNGWKIELLLSELGLTYEPMSVDFSKGEQKSADFVKYNPNGRIPAVIDHRNNDFVVWESCAIMLYVSEKYDTENKFAVTADEKYQVLQWLFFQASAQGPSFTDLGHAKFFNEDPTPSVIARHDAEVRRVLSVLESVLAIRDWLVGNKMTLADLSFIPWNSLAVDVMPENWDFPKEYPKTYAWHSKVVNRSVIAAILAAKMAAKDEAFKN